MLIMEEGSGASPVSMYLGSRYPRVPMTRVDTCVSPPSGPVVAIPKSVSFASRLWATQDKKSKT